MSIIVRPYKHPDDFESVGEFLIKTYQIEGQHRNWCQPRWEYMHYHPSLDESSLDRIGIWEDRGAIVGVVHPDLEMREVYFEIGPDYSYLRKDVLEYAQKHLYRDLDQRRLLEVYINETDHEFEAIAEDLGFQKDKNRKEDMSRLKIAHPFPCINCPGGICTEKSTR